MIDISDKNVDFVVGCDIVFDFENFEGLYSLLDQLFEKCGTKYAYIGFTHRFGDVESWFREGLRQHGFIIELARDVDQEWCLKDFTILIISK